MSKFRNTYSSIQLPFKFPKSRCYLCDFLFREEIFHLFATQFGFLIKKFLNLINNSISGYWEFCRCWLRSPRNFFNRLFILCIAARSIQSSSQLDGGSANEAVEVSSNYLVFLGGSSSTVKKTLGSRRNSVRISFYRFFSQSGAGEFHFQHPGRLHSCLYRDFLDFTYILNLDFTYV